MIQTGCTMSCCCPTAASSPSIIMPTTTWSAMPEQSWESSKRFFDAPNPIPSMGLVYLPTLRIIGPSKLAILRTLPLRHTGSNPSIGGSKILRVHEWWIFIVNVGKYTSPMDPMGMPPPPGKSPDVGGVKQGGVFGFERRMALVDKT